MVPPTFPALPPREDFAVGQRNPAFTRMGRRFKKWLGPEIRHDGDGYQPDQNFSSFDVQNVKLCQRLMGKRPTGVFTQAQWTTLMATDPIREHRVSAVSLNVRKRPDIEARVVGHVHKNDVVKVTGRSRDKYWLHVSAPGLEGWSSHKFLEKIPIGGPRQVRGAPWFKFARAELGVKEAVGQADNPRVVQYLKSTTLPPSLAAEDETHWCSAFVNFVMEKAGFEGTDSAMARSWTNWGVPIKNPRRGCITVFSRNEAGPQAGHVGFFVSQTPSTINLLGGNQGDAVTIAKQERSRLLGFRMPG